VAEQVQAPGPAGAPPRVIAEAEGARPGPTLVVVAGLHGNEPAGVTAAERVIGRLGRGLYPFRGRIVALAGNRAALARGVRHLAKDLNRQWVPDRIIPVLHRPAGADEDPEDAELRELHGALCATMSGGRGPCFFVDLHTSSAEGAPFLVVGDTLPNRRFAAGLPVPAILGLEEQLDGSLLEYLSELGFVTLGVEVGPHDDPQAVHVLESALWLALASAGLVTELEVPGLVIHRRRLRRATRKLPRWVEVRYRHAISPGDRFEMAPGFRTFDEVRAGQVLGRDRNGEVVAPEDGRVLLPLYQGQGEDGFFLGRDLPEGRLRRVALLRRLRLERLLPLLPGVRRLGPGRLHVAPGALERVPVDWFHLLGYRKWRAAPEGGHVVSRRTHLLRAPRSCACAGARGPGKG